jgi:EmrB/QacA subfamily drug resistance transporter
MVALHRYFERFDYKWLVASAFMFGVFMDMMDTTILNVALPTLSADFQASTATLEWVITGYLLSLAVWVPASGWIGDRFGNKRIYLFAVAVFVGSSALCGLAWSIESLIAFRMLQGIGGGLMTPVGMAMLYRAFSVQERARASAILTIPTSIAPMTGPLVGGFLVDHVSWRGIFFLNLPVGLACFLFALVALKEHREPAAGSFDPTGFVLSGVGLACFLFALSRGPEIGWTSPAVIAPGLLSVICFALLIWVERRSLKPMLDFGLFADRMFRIGILAAFVANAALAGIMFLMPLYLQQVRGFSAFESGLTTFPQTLGSLIMTQFTARTYGRFGPRLNILIGASGLAVSSLLLLLVGLQTDLWWIRALLFVRGTTTAFIFISAQSSAYARLPREKIGRAASLYQTQRQVGSALGVALLATVFISLSPAITVGAVSEELRAETLFAWHAACVMAAVLAAVGVGLALQIRRRDAFFAARGYEVEASPPAPVREPALARASD